MPNARATNRVEGITAGEHTPAEYALLGLLRDGPAHGYRLAEAFDPDGRLGLIVRLKMSQMYAYLHKLERLGWLSAHDEPTEPGRSRRIFTLTPAGVRAFDSWLASPVAATREVRLDFMLKLAFLLPSSSEAANALLARQRAATQTWLEHLRQQSSARERANGPADVGLLVLRHRIRQSEATLVWLDEIGAK